MKSELTVIFGVLSTALVLSITGCNPQNDVAVELNSTAGEGSSLVRVTTGPAVTKTLRLFTEQPGRVAAFEETPILSKIPGYVETVHFDIGDKVTKGQLLIRIRAPEYQDQLEQKRGLLLQAEAQVKQAEAALAAAQASANSYHAMVVQAQASVGRSEAEFARWDSEYQRIQQLVSKGSVTPKLADETASQYQAAAAAKQEALAIIESAKARQQEAAANVTTAATAIDAARAKVKVAQADIQQAETMLTYTELLSPFDGYVTHRRVDAGHYVQPAGASNAQPLMTIANVTKVRVFVNVPESEATWVDAGFDDAFQGDPVTIQIASGESIDARVTRTSLQLDLHSRSLSTEIDVQNTDLILLPGAFVTAKILLEERSDVLTLPISAIVKTATEAVCCVVVDGKIQHQPIKLGLRVGDDVQILSGLNGNEPVVLVRANSLRSGQAVEVIAEK
ncbi:MAG: efflux RND transporter periplasmic adaptor subunit [Pirellulaceae bacterium]|nr:efflux RND transporter periplasmic adaptor subunit [Pirellulaceae bacterium]